MDVAPNNRSSQEPWKGVPPVVEAFLRKRGFNTYQDACLFLDFSLKDMADPLTILGMEKALSRLQKAFVQQEAICIYGDFDMDGTPAVALMVRALKGLGFEKIFYVQPDRHKHGYGFHDSLAKEMIAAHDIRLFITVDVGITDVDAVEEIQNMGIDVIITDHHQEKETLPPAFTVLNPNQKQCRSGLKHLCGTGVAFYLVMALNRHLREQNKITKALDVKSLLDCFAIATIADLVPLVDENRILVKHGLKVLEKTTMVGIRALMGLLNLNDKTLSPSDVGIRLVPKLNSLTRMGGDLLPIDLFLVENPEEALVLAQETLGINEQRVKSLKTAEKSLVDLYDHPRQKNFFWSYSAEFHKGLVGLLAAKVVTATAKTAFVGALLSDGETIVGSARTAARDGHNVFEVLQACQSSLKKFGGHPQAAGFELSIHQAEEFQLALETFFSQQSLKDLPDAVHLQPDLFVDIRESLEILSWYERLEPFGIGFLPPVVAFKDIEVGEIRPLKGNHFRLKLIDQKGGILTALLFDHSAEPPSPQGHYQMVGEMQWNEFRGQKTPQLLVKEFCESYCEKIAPVTI